MAIGIHHENAVAPDGKASLRVPTHAVRRRANLGDALTFAGEFQNRPRRSPDVQEPIGCANERAVPAGGGIAGTGQPRLYQLRARSERKNLAGIRIEHLNQPVIADGNADAVFVARFGAKAQLPVFVTFGTKMNTLSRTGSPT